MRRLLTIGCLFIASFVYAEDAAIARIFQEAGIRGTLVIESAKERERFVHDNVRATRRYPAASTFKILHTLIALEEQVVTTAETVIPWDGTHHEMEQWKRDQTLASAFQVSCVWCYQSFARQIGAAAYPAHIQRAHYGSLSKPFDVTQFWLDGSLTISAAEQVAFLKQVVERRLSYPESSYDTLQKVMLLETTPGYRLYAKTGWAARGTPGIGWFVGYLETADDTWLFALNLDTHGAAGLPLRQKIALAGLRTKGILPPLPTP